MTASTQTIEQLVDELDQLETLAPARALDQARASLAAMTAERDAMRVHFDELAPEQNLLALLDLYHERELTAAKERDDLRGELVEALASEAAIGYALQAADDEQTIDRATDVMADLASARELIKMHEERAEEIDRRDDDARLVCEYVATWNQAAMPTMEAARRYLTGERSPVSAERDELKQHLGNLLARIHGDGGDYFDTHGAAKATADADAKICRTRSERDEGVELLRQLDRRGGLGLDVHAVIDAYLARAGKTS